MEDMNDHKINFVFQAHLHGFFFKYVSEKLSFTAPPPNQINLSLKSLADNMWNGLTCKVSESINVSRSAHKFVSSLLAGRFELGTDSAMKLPHVSLTGEEKIDAAGAILGGYKVPFQFFPSEVQTICDSVGTQLKSRAERFIKLLRWHQEIDGPPVLFDGLHSLYWNVGGTEFHAIGFPPQSSTGRGPHGITWDDQDQCEVRQIWDQAELSEPLAHEMLREATATMRSFPRSALLIAASAIEAGVKMHVGKIAPQTGWLVREMPSPPIFNGTPRLHPSLIQTSGQGVA
jgi:hypothetical protein